MSTGERDFLEAGFRHVTASQDLVATVENLVRSAIQAAGSVAGSLFLLNRARGVLEPYVLVNLPDEFLAGCASIPLGTQCCGRAAMHKVPWIVSDMWTDPLFADCREAAMKSGMRAGFSVPVLAPDGTCLGALGCQYREPYTPSTDTVDRISLFAQLVAFALLMGQAGFAENQQTAAD